MYLTAEAVEPHNLEAKPLRTYRSVMDMGEKMTTRAMKQLNIISKMALFGLLMTFCANAGLVSAQPCCNDNLGVSVTVAKPVSDMITAMPATHTVSYPTTPVGSNTYRVENETVYQQEEQTKLRQVWDDEVRERHYTVLKQVPETTIKQEIYKVLKPVWTTEYRDTSYDVIRTVPENSVREERYTVSRPTWETAEREVWQTVRRPVQETYMQERRYTVNRPVTSYKTEVVDRGQYVDYTAVEPGKTYNRLTWQSGGNYIDPNTGASRRQLPGLYWTPMQSDPKYRQEKVYQPNFVEQLTPVTTLVPETVVEQIPTTRTTFQEERILHKEPYQVMRMVQEERVRQIPETRYRQVVERVQQTTPVQVQRMETQEVTRDIPVTSFKTVAEEHVQQYTVRVPRVEKVVETVQKPYTVKKYIPLDEFGNPTTIFSAPITTPPVTTPAINGDATNGTQGTYGGNPVGDTNDPAGEKPTIPPQNSNQMNLGS